MNIAEIRQQYPQYSDLSDEQLAKSLHSKFYSDMPFDAFAQKAGLKAQPVEKPEPSTLSRAAAGAAGYNEAMLTGLPGLPVDTALNVADLARAGYGYLGGKFGLIKPNDLPQPLDRGKYVGSSAWLGDKIRQGGGGVFINNPNPDDPTSQFLNTTAKNLAGARTPGQAIAGAAAGASQATAEQMGLGPEGQIIASLLPQAAGAGGRGGMKGLLAGGDKARAEMRQNLQDLQGAGVEKPSAGLAGSRMASAIESLAARYPGAAGLMAENAKANQAGIGNRTRQIADQVSQNRGEAPTGTAIQQDITGRWKPKFDALYERLDDAVTSKVGNGPVGAQNALATTGGLLQGIPGAPNVSAMLLKGSGLPGLNEALRQDAGTMPYSALRAVGSEIGKQAGDNLLHGNAETGRYKQVYGAIAEDKMAAAQAAGAGRELERANNFYSQGATKMENVLQPYTRNGVTPEQAYNQFRSTILSSPGKAHELRRSLAPEVRQMQTATLIDELGQATPGKQDAAGSLFSSETFLTNWNKLSPSTKAVMFSGFDGAGSIRSDLSTVAKATELIRKKGGIYANPSGTGGAVAQLGVGGTIAVATATGNMPMLAGALGSVAAAHITARMFTNPKFVNWLASADKIIRPEDMAFHAKRLAVVANQTKDPEARREIEAFAASLAQQ